MRVVLELEVYYHRVTWHVTLIMEDGWWSNTWWVGGRHPGMFGVTRSGGWRHYKKGEWVCFYEDDEDGNIKVVASMGYVKEFPIKAGKSGNGRIYRSKYTKSTVDFHWRVREGA